MHVQLLSVIISSLLLLQMNCDVLQTAASNNDSATNVTNVIETNSSTNLTFSSNKENANNTTNEKKLSRKVTDTGNETFNKNRNATKNNSNEKSNNTSIEKQSALDDANKNLVKINETALPKQVAENVILTIPNVPTATSNKTKDLEKASNTNLTETNTVKSVANSERNVTLAQSSADNNTTTPNNKTIATSTSTNDLTSTTTTTTTTPTTTTNIKPIVTNITSTTTMKPATTTTIKITSTTTPKPITTPKPKKPETTYAIDYDELQDAGQKAETPNVQPSQELDGNNYPHRGRDYIVPIMTMIFIVPLVIGVIITTYRRFKDFWSTRHYRRMDFLVDGMYND